MRILGIDPGYAILGYGVIDTAGVRNTAVDYGVIETRADEPFPERLERLYAGMRQLIGLYRPDAAAFEELFFYRNTTTAISVGAGRGVALLAAQQSGMPLYEYTPMQIKLAVTGDGHADKHAVQQMVKKYATQAAPLKKHLSPHKLRSTFGTNLYRETGDIYLVADVLGHSDVNTTRRHYAAMADERRRMAARKVKLREDGEERPSDDKA